MAAPALDPSPSRPLLREGVIVAVLTLVGAIIRLWGLKFLGLVHFDEGTYALAGLWSLSPGGLSALDPMVIPYAPPGFPFLVGVSYLFFGASDIGAIFVSILAGTLTIPATAWLARRTFGAGAGACAAALVALSGFHIAFSRMALTDASFLLCWVLGLIAAQRFLERPGIASATVLGLSVGLAQLFKYNGWLIGAIVILAAAMGWIVDEKDRARSRLLVLWGSGLLAALVAAAVYWPWYRFVEAHGGYASLLAHQRRYIGSIHSWLPNLRLQLEQVTALSGGCVWEACVYLLALAGLHLVVPPWTRRQQIAALYLVFLTVAFFVLPIFYWIVGVVWMPQLNRWTTGQRVLGLGWLLLSTLTEFYHPYARLWLPLQHLGWVILPGLWSLSLSTGEGPPCASGPVWSNSRALRLLTIVVGLACLRLVYPLGHPVSFPAPFGSGDLPRPVARSDSVRIAVKQVLHELPPGIAGLRLLVRPPVTFYLGGRVPAQVEPNLDRLLVSGNPKFRALVDVAQLRQEKDLETAKAKLLSRWEIVHEYPTQLNLPTLLDVDPGAARSGKSDAATAPLWLLRPRTKGTLP
ncbi:MAG: ArnT family glycosyltransferase [Isosphaeraceae bacterium]